MAGYPGDMNKMLDTNPGLKSRFTHFIEFEDWSAEDCLHLFRKRAARRKTSILCWCESKLIGGPASWPCWPRAYPGHTLGCVLLRRLRRTSQCRNLLKWNWRTLMFAGFWFSCHCVSNLSFGGWTCCLEENRQSSYKLILFAECQWRKRVQQQKECTLLAVEFGTAKLAASSFWAHLWMSHFPKRGFPYCKRFYRPPKWWCLLGLAHLWTTRWQDAFSALLSLDGWGNARDVDKVWKAALQQRADRVVKESEGRCCGGNP